jgi:Domain of unknown function (DUF4326)/ParB-like nuclease domain
MMMATDTYQVMPPLSEEEYRALKEDIAENGVLVPVVKDEHGTIVDGYHRVQAYEELLAEDRIDGGYPIDERSGLTHQEKRDLAWRLNLNRRHLSRDQKQEAIKRKLKESPEWADNRIAKLLGVDGKTVGVQRVMLEGRKEIAKVKKLVGADGKSYPRQVEKNLRGAGVKPGFAIGVAKAAGQMQAPWATREASSPGGQEEATVGHFSSDEQELLETFKSGKDIVVDMREDGPHANLLMWLKLTDQLTRADRKTPWGNPFIENVDGDREAVVRLYAEHFLPFKLGLQDALSKMEGPTAWGCWCAPLACHCDVLVARKEGRSLF